MKFSFIFMVSMLLSSLAMSQPFRYTSGNDHDRDSIKLLKIKGFKEYLALFSDSSNRNLTRIVEFDRNGNMIRNWWHDENYNSDGQWTWTYDSDNRLLEHVTFTGDSLTKLQRFLYCYDSKGNEVEAITENFSEGKLVGTSRTTKEFDTSGHLLVLKVYGDKGIHTHYEYSYNQFGRKTEERVYAPDGTLQWKRPTSDWDYGDEERLPYGFPPDPDPELEALRKETIIYNQITGEKTISDGYGFRVFSKDGLLLKWYQTNFKYHWY
jgi:hypothetical protein